LNDGAANNSLTQQSSISVTETTVVISKLSKIKCVLVNGSRTGKSIICESFVNRKTSINTLPTMFDHYSTECVVDGVRYNLELWDTSGCENCERFRKRIYDNTDVFLICFSIYERKYLSDVTSDWIPEVRSLCSKAGIVLVGTATNSENKRNIAFDIDEGMLLAKQYHASSYVECSLSMEDIDAVFAAAVKAAVKARRRQSAIKNKVKQFGQMLASNFVNK
jgi:small GTP-binding protein